MTHNYKLSNETKEEIKCLKGKKSGYKIAKDYGISTTVVYMIWDDYGDFSKKFLVNLLKKMIPPFIDKNIRIKLEDKEINLIKKLNTELQ